jgi:hypothetical protein
MKLLLNTPANANIGTQYLGIVDKQIGCRWEVHGMSKMELQSETQVSKGSIPYRGMVIGVILLLFGALASRGSSYLPDAADYG